MLIITDVFGNSEALADFQNPEVNEEVNGDFSLSFTCFFSERNQHSYHLVQEESIVEWDGHEFRIKKIVESRNRKEVFAQHIFFELIDNQIYTINGGTLTLNDAMTFVLNGSGWTFENVDVMGAKLIPNFGEDNSLALTRAACNAFQCEVKIEPNRHLKFEIEVGSDEDFQFRYKHNVKTLKRTVDTSNLTTVVKGYGAEGLVVEYRSPNTAIYGDKHGEPIRDERFTDANNLIEKCKESIKDVPEITIELEVSQLGFDAHLGDKVWLIYEPMNIEFQTRILSVKSYPFTKRSPSVVLSNQRKTFVDLLTQTKIEVKEIKKETRSRIEQTNEKILLEVERIDESIASVELNADNIVLQVEALGQSVADVDIKADNISLSVEAIDGRVNSAESSISIQAGLISSKVEQNGIISAINQSPETIKFSAGRIDLSGITNVAEVLTIGSGSGGPARLQFNGTDTWIYSSGDGLAFESSGYIQFKSTVDFNNIAPVNFPAQYVRFG
jgi:phage minor structural protein